MQIWPRPRLSQNKTLKNIYFSNYSVFQKELKTIAKDNTEDKLVADDTFYIFIFASCSSSFIWFFGEGVFPQSIQSPKKPGFNRVKQTFQLEYIIGNSIFLSIFCVHLILIEGQNIDLMHTSALYHSFDCGDRTTWTPDSWQKSGQNTVLNLHVPISFKIDTPISDV